MVRGGGRWQPGERVGPGINGIRARTTHHQLGARAGRDLVTIAQRQVGRDDLRKQRACRIELHQTVVAQDGVDTVAGGDAVTAHSAQNGVVAVAGDDGVARAGAGIHIGAAVEDHQAGRVVAEFGVVTGNDVGTLSQRDGIGAEAADDDLGPITEHDHIVGAVRQEARFHQRENPGCRPGNKAVVAQHQIGAQAGRHLVGISAGKHQVIAVAGVDHIDATHRARHTAHLGHPAPAGKIRHFGVVTQHNIRAHTGLDVVGTGTTDHDVVASTDTDDLVTTLLGLGGRKSEQDAIGIPVHDSVVAQHDVVAVARRITRQRVDLVGAEAGQNDVA